MMTTQRCGPRVCKGGSPQLTRGCTLQRVNRCCSTFSATLFPHPCHPSFGATAPRRLLVCAPAQRAAPAPLGAAAAAFLCPMPQPPLRQRQQPAAATVAGMQRVCGAALARRPGAMPRRRLCCRTLLVGCCRRRSSCARPTRPPCRPRHSPLSCSPGGAHRRPRQLRCSTGGTNGGSGTRKRQAARSGGTPLHQGRELPPRGCTKLSRHSMLPCCSPSLTS